MFKLYNWHILFLLIIIFIVACNSQKVTKNQQKTFIDWESYSSKSIFKRDSIVLESFQGKWYAFRRSSGKIDKLYDNAKCPQPYVTEIKGFTFRRNPDSPFVNFSLKENNIIIPNQNRDGLAIINLITNDSLILTWKNVYFDKWENRKDTFYSRYFYKRSYRP